MSALNDGGPAFPGFGEIFTTDAAGQTGPQSLWGMHGGSGMSLRDWFAGQALAGWLADGATPNPEDAAGRAYGYADAMLGARASPVPAASDTAARLLLGEVLAEEVKGTTAEAHRDLIERIREVLR